MNTDLLKQAQDRGDNIKSIFTMTYVCTSPYHAYLVHSLPCHLFINVKDEKGRIVAPLIWMNHNQTMANLCLERGDVIQVEAYAEKYNLGGEYHRLNTTRGKHKIFRLLYPSNAIKIGQELVPYSKILNLSNLKVYDTFDDYTQSMNIISYETYHYEFIHLIDCTDIKNLFNRRGNVISTQYPIRCIFLDVWLALSPEQRTKILDNRKYTYTQIIDYIKLMRG